MRFVWVAPAFSWTVELGSTPYWPSFQAVIRATEVRAAFEAPVAVYSPRTAMPVDSRFHP